MRQMLPVEKNQIRSCSGGSVQGGWVSPVQRCFSMHGVRRLVLSLLFFTSINASADPIFSEQKIISTEASSVQFVYSADLDGDGDQDLLSASQATIAWYENTDGEGTFSAAQIITSSSLLGVDSVSATDLDGDGDLDILSASARNTRISWFENTDGKGTFRRKIITDIAEGVQSVYVADLDGDGDQDVIAASESILGGRIGWYENTDGRGTFSQRKLFFTKALNFSQLVYAADFDGDGDMDVLTASTTSLNQVLSSDIAWFENTDGKGAFGEQKIITTAVNFPRAVYTADLDGDGDQDVLSASTSRGSGKIAWYENMDGRGTFGLQKTLTTAADGASSVYATDLDGDGDQDVLSASNEDDKIAWYENTDGKGTFSQQKIITTIADGARSVYVADLDGDGDQDVLSASELDHKIAWYEISFGDSDGDGLADNVDPDNDNDGVLDNNDAFPLDSTESLDTDSDRIGNNRDTDDDGDRVADSSDAFPLDRTESLDTDNDGIGNNADNDDDGDGVVDASDPFPLDSTETLDTDGDGIGNNADPDDENDGLDDAWEITFGFDPLVVDDASLDPDEDGRSHRLESLGGTDPNDATAYPDLVVHVEGLVDSVILLLDNETVRPITVDGVLVINNLTDNIAGHKLQVTKHPAGLFCNPENRQGTLSSAIEVYLTCARLDAQLSKIVVLNEGKSTVRSVVKITERRSGKPIIGLQTSSFFAKDDGVAIGAESFLDSDPFDDISNTLKTVLMLDISQSLSRTDIETEKAAALSLIRDANGKNRLQLNQQIAIYTFDDEITQVADFTSAVSRDLLDAVDAIQQGGPSTNLYGAVASAAGLISAPTFTLDSAFTGNVILFTDGTDTAGISTLNQAVSALANKDIYVIALGSTPDLGALAEITGDARRVLQIANIAELSKAFEEVSIEISKAGEGIYNVYYASPKRSGTHSIEVGINDNLCRTCTITDSYNANGFSSESPILVVKGGRTVEAGKRLFLEAKVRYSNDQLVYQWSTEADSELTLTVDPTNPSKVVVESLGVGDDISSLISLEIFADENGTLFATDLGRSFTVKANDGVDASIDNCPTISNASQSDADGNRLGDACDDTDGDGISNIFDTDDDNDGVADVADAFALDASESVDTDGDGIGNNADTDDDNDGVPDVSDTFPLDARFSVNQAPDIALVGEALITINVGESFTDPGALAFDPEQGDLTSSIITLDNVNTASAGTYSIEYRVTNTLGILSSVTRIVTVLEVVACTEPVTGAVRFDSGQVIELPIRNICLTSPGGASLAVPASATAAAINVTAVSPSAAGFVTVWPCGVARPNASNLNFVAGDVVPNGVIAPIGQNGSVCLYSQTATDLIVDVAGWFEGEAFAGATPQRLVDTRDGTGGQLGQLVPSNPLVVQATGITATTAAGSVTTIPSGAGTVALNLTVVNPSGPGFITAYPCDAARPLASNVNYVGGQVVANGVIAPVSASGQVCLYSSVATDIIVDLAGWFPGEQFTGATPKRFVDTRDGTGAPLGKLSPDGQLSVLVQGAILNVNGNDAQVPLFAAAAALNVTVVNPEAAGFVTVWPCSAARPNASNLNFVPSQTVANNVVAPIGDQGNVCFYASQNTDIIVDVSGYFMGESGNQFVGAAPKRFVDTRDGTGPGLE
jgi:uncharacterized protein YegL